MQTMHKNTAMLTVACLMLCLTFNYTFPLHRENSKWAVLANHTQQCEKPEHSLKDGFVDRTKKMAANIESALKKIIDSAPDSGKINKDTRCTHAKQSLINGDLSNYEQLVIMKKYPYLDLKELDYNYRPPTYKNSRQSLESAPNLVADSSFCEPAVDGPNVEVINRGLTGFAIPSKLMKADLAYKQTNLTDADAQEVGNNMLKNASLPVKKRSSEALQLLDKLLDDIDKFEASLRV